MLSGAQHLDFLKFRGRLEQFEGRAEQQKLLPNAITHKPKGMTKSAR
jgi:hypothetical protein